MYVLSALVRIFYLALFCLLSAPADLPATDTALALPPSGAITGKTAHKLLADLNATLVVLDVRTPQEFAENHVRGAVNIPVQELKNRVGELPKDKPILILCRTGVRAATAYGILRGARPTAQESPGLWYLHAIPVYKPDGTFLFP